MPSETVSGRVALPSVAPDQQWIDLCDPDEQALRSVLPAGIHETARYFQRHSLCAVPELANHDDLRVGRDRHDLRPALRLNAVKRARLSVNW